MRFFPAALLALILSAFAPAKPHAQSEAEPIFASYEAMRTTLDQLMSKRQIADLLTAFGAADEMTLQEMTALETRVRDVFPRDFENVALMLREEMQNGFAQDLIAYWTDTSYIYVRVLWHQRPQGDVAAINMIFNSDPDVLIPLF